MPYGTRLLASSALRLEQLQEETVAVGQPRPFIARAYGADRGI